MKQGNHDLAVKKIAKYYFIGWFVAKVVFILTFAEMMACFLGSTLAQDATMENLRRHWRHEPELDIATIQHRAMVNAHLLVWSITIVFLVTIFTLYRIWKRNQWKDAG